MSNQDGPSTKRRQETQRNSGKRAALAAAIALALASLACTRGQPAPAPDARLMLVAQKAADAEEMHYHHAPGETPSYTDRLEDLLAYDESLTEDPAVTFAFGAAGAEGYQFTVSRPGAPTVACNADDGCRPAP